MLVFLLTIFFSFAFSEGLCIKEVHNPYSEVYLSYVFRKNVEKLVLESGYKIYCGEGSKEIKPEVELFKEHPIAYTPQQRVSAYNLELRVSLALDGKKKSFSVFVPYTQQGGMVGDLPRRKAIEEAFRIIYIDMLEFIKMR